MKIARIWYLGFAVALAIALVWIDHSSNQYDDGNRASSSRDDGRNQSLELALPQRERIPLVEPASLDRAVHQLSVTIVAVESGEVIAGANCVAVGNYGRFRAESDRDGIAVFPLDGNLWTGLEVTCSGFVGQVVQLAKSQDEARIELATGGHVSGVVMDELGNHAPDGLVVIAYRQAARPFSVENFLANENFIEGAEAEIVSTDVHGRFEFTRLAPHVRYQLRALGAGIVTRIRANVRAGDDNVALVGGKLLGAHLRFELESGELPRYSKAIIGSSIGPVRTLGHDRNLSIAWRTDDWCKLIGMPEEYYALSSAERAGYCFAWGSFSSQGEQSQDFHWNCRGYFPLEGSVALVPVGNGIPISTFIARETGLQWGSLEVEYALPEGLNWDSASSAPPSIFKLHFARDEATGDRQLDSFSLRIDPRKHGVVAYPNIPAGTYVVSRQYDMGMVHGGIPDLPESRLTILPGGSTRLKLDFTQMGAVDFLLTDVSLREYRGPFNGALRYRLGDHELTAQFRFEGPPYRLCAVPPGEYQFVFDGELGKSVHPKAAGSTLESSGFTTNAGHLVEVDYQVAVLEIGE